MAEPHETLDELVRLVQASDKYSHISVDLVRELGKKELSKRRNLKEAVKETRNKLHQIGASYQEKPVPYADWMTKMRDLPHDLHAPESVRFINNCLPLHSSTAERISILSTFFKETLVELGPVRSILDLACGLTPLTLPWMPVSAEIEYHACDIYQDMTSFLNLFFAHYAVKGSAFVCDLTAATPPIEAQVAFLLKTIPCLDQVDKSAAGRLLRELKTSAILVSFPAHSLGGRSKGMLKNYEARFWQLVEGEAWKITRFEFTGELAFLIRK